MKGGHKKRVEKVREFTSHNKVFTAFAVILIAFLLFRTASDKAADTESSQAEQSASQEAEPEDTGWRFYPIDLVVLGVGGGFCSIMIIRERRKAKEGLN